jgi:hypothetical protein
VLLDLAPRPGSLHPFGPLSRLSARPDACFCSPALLIAAFLVLATQALSSTPVGDSDPFKKDKSKVDANFLSAHPEASSDSKSRSSHNKPPVRLGTLVARRTFEEPKYLPGGSTISASIAPFLKSKATSATNGGAPVLPPDQYYAKLSGDTLYLHKTADFSDSQAIGICLWGHEVETCELALPPSSLATIPS